VRADATKKMDKKRVLSRKYHIEFRF